MGLVAHMEFLMEETLQSHKHPTLSKRWRAFIICVGSGGPIHVTSFCTKRMAPPQQSENLEPQSSELLTTRVGTLLLKCGGSLRVLLASLNGLGRSYGVFLIKETLQSLYKHHTFSKWLTWAGL